MKTLFKNKSKGIVQFWAELGISDIYEMVRLPNERDFSMEVYEPNGWCQYEQVIFRNAYNIYDEQIQIVTLKKRGSFKKGNLEAPIMEVNVNWDLEKEKGNAPSPIFTYLLGDIERKLNLMLNIPFYISIPKESFVSPYEKLVLERKIEPFSKSDWSENRVANSFHLALKNRRSDNELRKLGIIKLRKKGI